jgi:hypothetical protein
MEPKRLTTDELKQKYSSPVSSSTSNIQTTPKRLTTDELKQKYSNSESTKPKSPTFVGQAIRGIVKPVAKVGTSIANIGQTIANKPLTQPFSGDYLGEVKPVGAGFDVTKGVSANAPALKDAVGTGLDLASNIPMVRGAGALGNVLRQPFKQTAIQSAKRLGTEGAAQGFIGETGRALQENKNLGETLYQGGVGGVVGGVLGGALGVGGAGLSRAFSKTPESVITQRIDKDIKKLYQNTTADIGKINQMTADTKKGFELLVNESPNIKIPDIDAPIGSNATKQFDISKATPNEMLSAVEEIQKKAVNNARTAINSAKSEGLTIDINNAKQRITDALNNNEVSPLIANRVRKEIENAGNDPVKIFDWIQDVNIKYGKNYDRGNMQDNFNRKLIDDVATILRGKLNEITDRTGYASSMRSIMELKRAMVAMAKQANKNVNFGDITTDAGIDSAIALITGNPAYMARTAGSVAFKGLMNRLKKSQTISAVRRASSNIAKIPNETNFPSTELKQRILRLPAPKEGADTFSPIPMKAPKAPTTYEAPAQKIYREPLEQQLRLSAPTSKYEGFQKPINMPSRKAIDQGTEVVPKPKLGKASSIGEKADPLISEARKYKSAEEFYKAQTNPLLEFNKLNKVSDDIGSGTVKEAIDDIGGIDNVRRGTTNINNLEITEKINTYSERYKAIENEVKNGNITPIIVDKYLRVLDGHHRLEVYKSMGMKDIPVIAPKMTSNVKLQTKSQLTDIWNKANKVSNIGALKKN